MKRKITILQNELGLQIESNIKDMNTLTWHVLIELEMFTFEELNLVIRLTGDNIETLNDVLFIRYGYRDIEQFLESEYCVNLDDEETNDNNDLYNDVLELRNRIMNDPDFTIFEEDGQTLDRVLDFLDGDIE